MDLTELINLLPLKALSYSSLISFVLIVLKTGIDTIKMTGVERIILTDSKKLLIFLSQISIVSLFLSVAFF